MTVSTDKWGTAPATRTVSAFHDAIRRRFAERVAASGKTWEEAVFDPELELTREDLEAVEQELLDTGYRYEHSAQISLTETPEKYRAGTVAADAPEPDQGPADEQGRVVVGSGDNVFLAAADVVGTARFVSTVETVMQMLVDGVPPETIAVIDDSGGTLTAPVIEGFHGILCLGGTIRSHLGILSREYGIPCLMAVSLEGLRDGDRVQVEYSKPPREVTSQEVISRGGDRAQVWRLADGPASP